MNEKIKDFAEQAGMEWDTHIWCWLANPPHLEKFAELVRQDEREAQVCCGDYEKCIKACTPKGRWLANQQMTRLEQEKGQFVGGVPNVSQQREWVGLTDDEINKIVDLNTSDDGGFDIWCDGIAVAHIVCAKLKEKNA